MNTRQGETLADGGDGKGPQSDRVGTGSTTSLPPTSDKPAPSITCRYADTPLSAACGAFSVEAHKAAAAAGLCCVEYGFGSAGGGADV